MPVERNHQLCDTLTESSICQRRGGGSSSGGPTAQEKTEQHCQHKLSNCALTSRRKDVETYWNSDQRGSLRISEEEKRQKKAQVPRREILVDRKAVLPQQRNADELQKDYSPLNAEKPAGATSTERVGGRVG